MRVIKPQLFQYYISARSVCVLLSPHKGCKRLEYILTLELLYQEASVTATQQPLSLFSDTVGRYAQEQQYETWDLTIAPSRQSFGPLPMGPEARWLRLSIKFLQATSPVQDPTNVYRDTQKKVESRRVCRDSKEGGMGSTLGLCNRKVCSCCKMSCFCDWCGIRDHFYISFLAPLRLSPKIQLFSPSLYTLSTFQGSLHQSLRDMTACLSYLPGHKFTQQKIAGHRPLLTPIWVPFPLLIPRSKRIL